ncbi:MAG: DNA-protecting protein DprA [Cellvibrionales bacterium]|nr:DNA-protecting protein DprA [Cellvibrionales bacterium]
MDFAVLCAALALPNSALLPALRHCGSPAELLEAPPDDLAQFFDATALKSIKNWQKRGRPPPAYQSYLEALRRTDAHTMACTDADYPPLLNEIGGPPALLFVRGERPCLSMPQVAMVGSRKASRAGEQTAAEFAADLGAAGLAVTSGLALGIDRAAHLGALRAQAPTLAVMGTGIDRIYPPRHRELAERILQGGGALISEFVPGTAPLPRHFPQRNRVVTGLSLGVVVVEAGERSGSLISARLAAEQGREVFAVPGSVRSPVAAGCHRLIRDGATLVTSARQIMEPLLPMLNFQIQAQPDTPENAENSSTAEPDHWLIKEMDFAPISVDELCTRCNKPAAEITAALVDLELLGRVEATETGYRRI